jgi:cytochrome P450
LLRLDTANRDPAVFPHPEVFDPTRDNRAVLTFGHGPHGCPGDRHALALAAGVIDALRHRCRSVDPVVDHEPSANLRIPRSLVVRLV